MVISTDTRLNQVKSLMLSYITQNELKRNDQLPSEAAIAKKFGVSRNTLREAYVSLENDGIIVRRHGIGTFIAHPPLIQDSLNNFSPFASIIQSVGYTANFQTLSNTLETAPPDVCDVLKLKSTDLARNISRLVFADQKPVIYVDDFIPPVVDAVIPSWDKFEGNMVEVLANTLETQLYQIQSYIRADSVSPEIGGYLELAEGTPVLSVRSTIFTQDNQAVNYSKLIFNSSIIELNIVRKI